MGKWLKSATQKTYTIQGYIVPANVTTDNRYLHIEDEVYNRFLKNPVVASLVKTGGIIVLDKDPVDHENDPAALVNKSVLLERENEDLKRELESLKSGNTDLQEARDEVARLKAALEALQSSQDEE